jgi:SSS family solute:Na+ symporter
VRTDKLQFILMYAGFILLLAVLWQKVGSPAEIWARLPATHTEPTGGQSIAAILVWYFIALATLIEPTFYQRCYAAKDERTARNGIWIAIGFWFVFDLLTTLSGLYAAAIYTNLADPVSAFPQLAADYLPHGLRGIFWVTLLAVIMSTVDSYTFTASVTAGRDLLLGPAHRRGDDAELRWSRAALPLVAILAVVLALFFRSVVDIWYVFGSIGTPALLLPVLTTFSTRLRYRPAAALANIIVAGGVALAWEILRGAVTRDTFPLSIPSIYPGLAVSLIIWIAGRHKGEKAG